MPYEVVHCCHFLDSLHWQQWQNYCVRLGKLEILKTVYGYEIGGALAARILSIESQVVTSGKLSVSGDVLSQNAQICESSSPLNHQDLSKNASPQQSEIFCVQSDVVRPKRKHNKQQHHKHRALAMSANSLYGHTKRTVCLTLLCERDTFIVARLITRECDV